MLRLLLLRDAASTQWRPRHLRRRDAITSLSYEETFRFALALALASSVPFPRRCLIAATRSEAAAVAVAAALNLRAHTSRALTAAACARANGGDGGVGAGRHPSLRRDVGVRRHVDDLSRDARLIKFARIVHSARASTAVCLRVISSTGQNMKLIFNNRT